MGWAIRQRWDRLPTPLRVTLALALLLLFVPWVSVQALPAPWAFIFGAWALAMFLLAFGRPRRRNPALWFNVGIALLTLSGVEVYLEVGESARATFDAPIRTNYIENHADLGYAPIPGAVRTISKHVGDQVIYEVTYTIDETGVRIGPPTTSDAPEPAVFFGCSMTYGEGVEDDETFPYLVGVLTGGRVATVNFAFSGYGPHQMLATLESGRAAAAVSGHPRHVFFMTIPAHAQRVNGNANWDKHGPRYRLTDHGEVRRDGQFVDERSAIARRIGKWVWASNIYQRLRRRWVRPEPLELMVAVVAAARDRAAAIWPGCRFHVLFYDRPAAHNVETKAALEARGLEVHSVSEMIPDFLENYASYALHRADDHPNARATRGIAQWIVTEFLDGAAPKDD